MPIIHRSGRGIGLTSMITRLRMTLSMGGQLGAGVKITPSREANDSSSDHSVSLILYK